jgi:hypothetical protein
MPAEIADQIARLGSNYCIVTAQYFAEFRGCKYLEQGAEVLFRVSGKL